MRCYGRNVEWTIFTLADALCGPSCCPTRDISSIGDSDSVKFLCSNGQGCPHWSCRDRILLPPLGSTHKQWPCCNIAAQRLPTVLSGFQHRAASGCWECPAIKQHQQRLEEYEKEVGPPNPIDSSRDHARRGEEALENGPPERTRRRISIPLNSSTPSVTSRRENQRSSTPQSAKN